MSKDKPKIDLRIAALRRFAIAITVFNIIGRTWFGFEGAWSQVLVTALTAYVLEIVFEILDARLDGRKERFRGGIVPFVNFLLPAHIGSFAISMLLYATDKLLPYAFAAAIMILSKYIFNVSYGNRKRHFLNPSNTGIAVTAFLFPSIQITVPYQFTEHLTGIENLLLPLFVVVTGTMLNYQLTKRIPLIIAWVGGFAVTGYVRAVLFGYAPETGLMMMSGVGFVLFTFYMVSDPGTTPFSKRGQIAFGLSLAVVYQILVMLHHPFSLFYALLLVCSIRGIMMYAEARQLNRAQAQQQSAEPEVATLNRLGTEAFPAAMEPVREAAGNKNE